MHSASRIYFILLLIAGGLPSYASAATFIKIADTQTPVPGGVPGEVFSDGFANPIASDGIVIFAGSVGIYEWDAGSLSVIADNKTDIPGTSSAFSSFNDLFSASNGNLAFGSGGGIYARLSGALTNIVNISSPVPGFAGTFNTFNPPSISGVNVAFSASATQRFTSQVGIYSRLNQGPLNLIANNQTPAPSGTGNLSSFGTPVISGTDVIFSAYGPSVSPAIYSNPDGAGNALVTLVAPNTSIPGGTGSFTNITGLSASGSNIAFIGTGTNNQRGLYADFNNILFPIVDASTLIPDGSGDTFSANSLLGFSLNGNNFAFTAGSGPQSGIYLDEDGILSKVLTVGDTLDGKIVSDLSLTSNALDGSDLAFTVDFTDHSSAVYLAVIPEPGTFAIFVIVSCPIFCRRWR
ncbi:MAG TPA: hypothetical protein VFE58_17560 [Tepidisphaeraceae bacterium]|jgi:hypothetical protein|nr:hypothetical protein [Tepidisphaeraceae bacterium]